MVELHESQNKVTRENVLALDIARHTGYYSMHGSGTWNFTESKRRNDNKEHKAFRDTVMDFILEHDIKVVVAEDVSVNQHFIDTRKLSEFRGILLEICDTLDLPEPIFINPTTIKKWATGDGHADKNAMIRFCRMRWNTDPVDDNEADATHIFMYYIKKFKL